MGREAAESLHHRPDAAATAAAAAILMERSGCARLFPPRRRSRREAPRALIPPPSCSPRPPPLSAHTPHTQPEPLAALPFLFRPASPPSAHPLCALARPAPPRPDLCQRPEGKRAARYGGGSRVSGRWRRLWAGRGYTTSAAPAGFALRGGSARAGSVARPVPCCSASSPGLPHPRGEAVKFAGRSGSLRVETAAGQRIRSTRLAPHLAS